MGIFQQLRSMAFQRQLKRGLQERKTPKGKSEVNLSNAKQIGILFNATAVDDRSRILKYASQLRDQGKQVSLLGFLEDQTELEQLAFPAYNKKGLDWAGRPKAESIKAFMQQPFDLLMNIDLSPGAHEGFITALSRAKLRVGPSTEHTECYDLMIDPGKSASLSKFIQQMEALLGKTNTTNEAA